MSNIEREEKYMRQMMFADPAKFKLPVTILGLGASGSVSAIGLAKMGIPKLRLIDFDYFDRHNVANQLCLEEGHLGRGKAESIADLALQMSALPKEAIQAIPGKLIKDKIVPSVGGVVGPYESAQIKAKDTLEGIILCCVDDMEARKDLWDACKYNTKTPYLIDIRMAAQYVIIYCVSTMQSDHCKFYQATLHSNEDATPEPCGERGIIYTTFFVGAIAVDLVKKLQMGQKCPRQISQDLHNFSSVIDYNGNLVTNQEQVALATL